MPILFWINSAYNRRVLSFLRHLLSPVCSTELLENSEFPEKPPEPSVFYRTTGEFHAVFHITTEKFRVSWDNSWTQCVLQDYWRVPTLCSTELLEHSKFPEKPPEPGRAGHPNQEKKTSVAQKKDKKSVVVNPVGKPVSVQHALYG